MTIIGLAGNPNTGKSTLFNALTGSNQHVGNWQGKTVEKQAGRLIGHDILLVDLPGTYSLTAYSIEEIIARDFILEEHPDAVVAVVDAANLERNLYLVVQLLEMGTSLILALNMSDIAESRGIQIDVEMLSQKLGGIPVVPTAGCRGTGLDDLKMAITQPLPVCQKPLQVLLPVEMEQEITRLVTYIQQKHDLSDRYIPRWLAIKLLERDENIIDKLAVHPDLIDAAEAAAAHIEQALEEEPDIFVAESRYDLIAEWVRAVVTRPDGVQPTFSDKLDKILTHRFWGLPVFFVFMWFVFQITANVSAPYLDWIDGVINQQLIRWAGNLLNVIGLEDTWFGSLMVDGVITGVGGVLVFIPVLVSLYVTLAILEDSGYMARAAFVMDRFMHTLGLQGKSFLPLLVGFGCTVPAVYATRTLENETDRKITGFLTTFMSCGARLPVYVLFGAIFFDGSGTFIFAMYLVGIGVAVLTALLLTKLVYRDKPSTPFVMELPPYRLPNPVVIWRSTQERITAFIQNAGTVILAASIFIWLLLAVPVKNGATFNEAAPEDSLFGTAGEWLTPILDPAGFGNWQAGGSLITGFAAKEVVITTMNQIYTDEEEIEEAENTSFAEDVQDIGTGFLEATVLTVQEVINIMPRMVNLLPGVHIGELDFSGTAQSEESNSRLRGALENSFTPLSALAFNVFVLLYVPCMAAVGAMRHEFGMRWTLAQVGYTLFVAWLVAVLVYQTGSLAGV